MRLERIEEFRRILRKESVGIGERKWVSYGLTSEERAYLYEPFPFLVGVIADGAHNGARRSWALPYRLRLRIGHLTPKRITKMPLAKLERALAKPPVLHRYPSQTAQFIARSACQIHAVYNGNTSALWAGHSAVEIIGRIDALHGVGFKKAHMMVKMLIRDRGLEVNDMHEVHLAPDVIVGRVLVRAGLARDASVPEVVRVGRLLNSSYPALFDDAIHLIGQNFCHDGRIPECSICPLQKVCARRGIEN